MNGPVKYRPATEDDAADWSETYAARALHGALTIQAELVDGRDENEASEVVGLLYTALHTAYLAGYYAGMADPLRDDGGNQSTNMASPIHGTKFGCYRYPTTEPERVGQAARPDDRGRADGGNSGPGAPADGGEKPLKTTGGTCPPASLRLAGGQEAPEHSAEGSAAPVSGARAGRAAAASGTTAQQAPRSAQQQQRGDPGGNDNLGHETRRNTGGTGSAAGAAPLHPREFDGRAP